MIEVVCLLLVGALIGAIVLVIVAVAIGEPPRPVERPDPYWTRTREIDDIKVAAVMRMLKIASEDSDA